MTIIEAVISHQLVDFSRPRHRQVNLKQRKIDRSGKGALIQFAVLDKGLKLTFHDFDVIARGGPPKKSKAISRKAVRAALQAFA
jgi:hypothetical protein